jgi:hypothetical protein
MGVHYHPTVWRVWQAHCHLALTGIAWQSDRRCGCYGDRRGFAVRPHLSRGCIIVVGFTCTGVGL